MVIQISTHDLAVADYVGSRARVVLRLSTQRCGYIGGLQRSHRIRTMGYQVQDTCYNDCVCKFRDWKLIVVGDIDLLARRCIIHNIAFVYLLVIVWDVLQQRTQHCRFLARNYQKTFIRTTANRWNSKQSHQSPVLLQPTKGLNYLLGTAPSSIEPAETDIRLINSPVQTVRDSSTLEEFIIHVENRQSSSGVSFYARNASNNYAVL